MEVIPRLRPLGTKWLLWLSFGALTAILVAIGCIGLLRLHSIATNFEKDHNIAKPRASVGHELEINIIGYSLSVWRYSERYRWGAPTSNQRRGRRGAADRCLYRAGRNCAATGIGLAAAHRLAGGSRFGRGADGDARGESRQGGPFLSPGYQSGTVFGHRVTAGRGIHF